MSKRKRFHGMKSKRQEQKAYTFFHSMHPYGSVRGAARMNVIEGRTAAMPKKLKKTEA